jgi:hypothetical protein
MGITQDADELLLNLHVNDEFLRAAGADAKTPDRRGVMIVKPGGDSHVTLVGRLTVRRVEADPAETGDMGLGEIVARLLPGAVEGVSMPYSRPMSFWFSTGPAWQ